MMAKNNKLLKVILNQIDEARNCIEHGSFEDAISILQSCLYREKISSANLKPNILYELGYCYLRLGWFKEAVEVYNQYIEANPSNPDARFFRASAYASLQWTDEAIKELRIILSSDSTDVLARHELALCFRDKGWIKESLNEMKRANAYAMIYGNPEEQGIVASSLTNLEGEIENGNDDRHTACFLALIFILMMMKIKMRKPSKGLY